MAHAGLHHISGAEKLVDRLGLLGALDDHQGRQVAVGREIRNYRRIFPGRRSWQRDAFGAALRLGAGFFGPVSSPRGVVCLDLRATVLSYLSYSQKTAWVDPDRCRADDLERVIEIVLLSDPATMKERAD